MVKIGVSTSYQSYNLNCFAVGLGNITVLDVEPLGAGVSERRAAERILNRTMAMTASVPIKGIVCLAIVRFRKVGAW